MSYSRWGGRGSGHWYTYWHIQDEETENRDTAIFCVCGVTNFTAKELRKNIDSCMKKVQKMDNEGDLDELKKYALEFIDDIDGEYPIMRRTDYED